MNNSGKSSFLKRIISNDNFNNFKGAIKLYTPNNRISSNYENFESNYILNKNYFIVLISSYFIKLYS